MLDIKTQVIAAIADKLQVDKSRITTNSSLLEDLELDSLDAAELIMAFEEKFDIEISNEVAETMTTVGDVVRFYEDKLG